MRATVSVLLQVLFAVNQGSEALAGIGRKSIHHWMDQNNFICPISQTPQYLWSLMDTILLTLWFHAFLLSGSKNGKPNIPIPQRNLNYLKFWSHYSIITTLATTLQAHPRLCPALNPPLGPWSSGFMVPLILFPSSLIHSHDCLQISLEFITGLWPFLEQYYYTGILAPCLFNWNFFWIVSPV